MMPVHVPHQKIKNGHVHDVVQPPALVVGRDFPDQRAVITLRLPLSFPPLVIRSPPGVSPHLKRTATLINQIVHVVIYKTADLHTVIY